MLCFCRSCTEKEAHVVVRVQVGMWVTPSPRNSYPYQHFLRRGWDQQTTRIYCPCPRSPLMTKISGSRFILNICIIWMWRLWKRSVTLLNLTAPYKGNHFIVFINFFMSFPFLKIFHLFKFSELYTLKGLCLLKFIGCLLASMYLLF